MNESSTPVFGGCRCGACRFLASAAPFQVSYCHCSDCRRATGAPVTVFAGFRDAEIEMLGEDAASWQAVPGISRLFCGQCGTPIGYRDDRLPGETYYYIGVLEEPARFEPRLHAFTAEQLAWLEIGDELPRHAGFSRRP